MALLVNLLDTDITEIWIHRYPDAMRLAYTDCDHRLLCQFIYWYN